MIFSVIFEVRPRALKWENYLAAGKALRPELEKITGFIDNIRYASLVRPGTVLSLSNWETEKALVRWRTTAKHHLMQEKGRQEILEDYHLRVAEVLTDSLEESSVSNQDKEQRLDETEVGLGTALVLIDTQKDTEWINERKGNPRDIALSLGLDFTSDGLVDWDIFEAVLSPGDLIMLVSWKDRSTAEVFKSSVQSENRNRIRVERVVRDYGMFDRREAPQYYPDADGRETIHS